MRQSMGQRYRQGYDAAASRDLLLAEAYWDTKHGIIEIPS